MVKKARPPVPASAIEIAMAKRAAGMKNAAVAIPGGNIIVIKGDGSIQVRKGSAKGAGGDQADALSLCEGKGLPCIETVMGGVLPSSLKKKGKTSRCYTRKDGTRVCYPVLNGRKTGAATTEKPS